MCEKNNVNASFGSSNNSPDRGLVVSDPLPLHPPAVLDFAAAVHLVQVADAASSAVAAAGRLEEEVEARFPALRLRAGHHKSPYQVMPHDAENIYRSIT